jgi:hypothetical protein
LTPDLTPKDCANQPKTARIARRFKKEKALQIVDLQGFQLAPQEGLEPTTLRLTGVGGEVWKP